MESEKHAVRSSAQGLLKRFAVDPAVFSGKAIIRGIRIPVELVLNIIRHLPFAFPRHLRSRAVHTGKAGRRRQPAHDQPLKNA
jgi:hypothetical protein